MPLLTIYEGEKLDASGDFLYIIVNEIVGFQMIYGYHIFLKPDCGDASD